MKMVKSLILGSAAGLIAMSGAQAADLPVKAKAVEYVRICSLYGAGFFYIPGTDTCIKLGGYLRVDTTFNGGIYHAPAWSGNLGQQNRYRDYFASRSRLAFNIDTRTATEYGVVRTFGQANFNMNAPSGNGEANSQTLGVDMVFIQFAGFTFGKSASAFSTPWHGYPGNNSSFLQGGHDTVVGINNIQYTAQFGNGVSATIGLDDPNQHRASGGIYNLSVGSATAVAAVGGVPTVVPSTPGLSMIGVAGNAYAGARSPDIVGNIRVDQAWGLFQLSGGLHLNTASYNTLTAGTAAPSTASEISGHPDDKWGGAVSAALQIKNIPTGAGDSINVDVTYAKGNTQAVLYNAPNLAMFHSGGTPVAGAYQTVGFGSVTDAVYSPGAGGTNGLRLTEAWGIRGAFNHNWDPYWSSSLFGSYSAIRYNGAVGDLTSAKGAYCNRYALSNTGAQSADFACNPDFNLAQLGVITRWTPVRNLTFSAEVMWTHLDQGFAGTKLLNMGSTFGAPKPTAVYEYKDQDTFSMNVRVNRNF